MPDALDLVGQALAIFAKWLDKISSPLPWPLVLGLLFMPLVAVFRTVLWVLRGRAWPVTCKYFHTQQRRSDKPCRTPVPGEWHYCRHHKHPRKMSDGHMCDPAVQRWQRKTRSGKIVERSDVRGVGFVSLMSNRDTLLFHRGVARRPRDACRNLPQLPRQMTDGLRALRSVSLRDLIAGKGQRQNTPQGVAERMPRVVQATRVAVTAFLAALLLTGLSVLLPGGWQHRVLQYTATGGFVLAANHLRFGAFSNNAEAQRRWVRSAIVDSIKSMGVFLGIALATVLLNAAGHKLLEPPKPLIVPSHNPTVAPATPAPTPTRTR